MPQYAGGLPGAGLAVAAAGGPSFYVGSTARTASSSTTTSIVIPLVPCSDGHIRFICVLNQLDVVLTGPAGWTQLGTRTTPAGSNYFSMWYRVKQSGDGDADVTVTAASAVLAAATSHAFKNVTLGPNFNKGTGSNNSIVQIGSFSTTVANSYVVAFMASDNGATTREWLPAASSPAMISLYTISSSNLLFLQQCAAYYLKAATGATGFINCTNEDLSNCFAYGIELIPV